jgi:SAM-dependent methyltransferase
MEFVYQHRGFCPCCESRQTFTAKYDWYRDHLTCPGCGSVVRERALALVLRETLPDWRALAIHESSPCARGLSAKLAREGTNYIATHYFPNEAAGAVVKGFRNENLEAQTFGDAVFDLVVTFDVMEHVYQPERVYSEVYRTLKPGGYYLHTFPIRKHLVEAATPLAELGPDGAVRHLTDTPEYHGNPIDEQGALVTFDYGYDISARIARWAPFDVRISRFWDQTHGLIGEYTEVISCRKPG